MTKDPKITMDTVRLAVALQKSAHCALSLITVQQAAELERLGRRVKALNTKHANDGAEASDLAADRATDRAAKLAHTYGAKFSRFGRGSGLWPYVQMSNGDEVSL